VETPLAAGDTMYERTLIPPDSKLIPLGGRGVGRGVGVGWVINIYEISLNDM